MVGASDWPMSRAEKHAQLIRAMNFEIEFLTAEVNHFRRKRSFADGCHEILDGDGGLQHARPVFRDRKLVAGKIGSSQASRQINLDQEEKRRNRRRTHFDLDAKIVFARRPVHGWHVKNKTKALVRTYAYSRGRKSRFLPFSARTPGRRIHVGVCFFSDARGKKTFRQGISTKKLFAGKRFSKISREPVGDACVDIHLNSDIEGTTTLRQKKCYKKSRFY